MTGTRNPNLGVIATAPQDLDGEPWRKNLGRLKTVLGLPRAASWWTGLAPSQCPGFDGKALHSLPTPNLTTCTRSEVLDYFENTWTLNELLFSSLIGEEPFYRPPYHALRHPLIFYYVHPSVLYVSKLRLAGLLEQPVNAYFENLFETGVDEMSWDDMSKNVIEWPGIDDCTQYRRKVYALIKNLIETHPDLGDGHPPLLQDHPLWALFMGFEHERIHLETSSVLIRELPVHLVASPPEWPVLPLEKSGVKQSDIAPGQFLEISEKRTKIGKPADWPTFGWDNEYGERQVSIGAFEAGQQLTSNAEYWQFVSSGGYHERANWSETGWRWRSFRNVKWPTFWVPDGPAGAHQYRLRTCFEIVPMQWSWPAVVNYHEAQAYCRWRSSRDNAHYRLITEAEHQALRQVNGIENGAMDSTHEQKSYNCDLRFGSESPVSGVGEDASENSATEKTFHDLFGNVWQWAEDHFNPLPGFAIHRLYDDFSTPCFDGQHQMIIGGSFISTGDEASAWARFHFRPHFFQHAGFRMVRANGDGGVCLLEDISKKDKADSPERQYSVEYLRAQYLDFQFSDKPASLPLYGGPPSSHSYPQLCSDVVMHVQNKTGFDAALVIGCTVGGSVFSLAKSFDRVDGIDSCSDFIDTAKTLKEQGRFRYEFEVSGGEKNHVARVDAALSEKVSFHHVSSGNAVSGLKLRNRDVVVLDDLLGKVGILEEYLPLMAGDSGLVRPDGLLVIVSDYEHPQAREEKIGQALQKQFQLLKTQELPLVMRQSKRRYQYIIAEATVWRRKN